MSATRELLKKYIVNEVLDDSSLDPYQETIVNEWDDMTLENLELESYEDVEDFMEFVEGLDEEDFIKVSYLADIGQDDYQYVMEHYNNVIVFSGSLEDAAKEEMYDRFHELAENSELERYIDYDAYANDQIDSGCWYEYEGYIILNADQY